MSKRLSRGYLSMSVLPSNSHFSIDLLLEMSDFVANENVANLSDNEASTNDFRWWQGNRNCIHQIKTIVLRLPLYVKMYQISYVSSFRLGCCSWHRLLHLFAAPSVTPLILRPRQVRNDWQDHYLFRSVNIYMNLCSSFVLMFGVISGGFCILDLRLILERFRSYCQSRLNLDLNKFPRFSRRGEGRRRRTTMDSFVDRWLIVSGLGLWSHTSCRTISRCHPIQSGKRQ